ncbi:MAG: HAMP domain-containing histidine kinase [Planctomycetes bacterium]|nr:HAMP domain-containing histidine kinase [Planctomycetota bacterium]
MSTARSRLSHRHLLALGTFLVPLAILTVLGWSELQRTGALAQTALDREGRTFVESAQKAVDQQLDRYVQPVLDRSEVVLHKNGPVRTTLALQSNREFAALRGIVLLDDQMGVVWPLLPSYTVAGRVDLPSNNAWRPALTAADLLLQNDHLQEAIALLEHVLGRIEAEQPRGDRPGQRWLEHTEAEAVLRFRLGAAQKKFGTVDKARTQFELVKRLLQRTRRNPTAPPLALVNELALAELGGPADRLQLLRDIAANRFESHPDGYLSAVAQDLAASFPPDVPDRAEVDDLLNEEHVRASIRTFADGYELLLRPFLQRRRGRAGGEPEPSLLRRIDTLHGELVVVCVRPATAAEQAELGCRSVGLQFDVRTILGPLFQQFALGGTFTLAVLDPDDRLQVQVPNLPEGYQPPTAEIDGLKLAAHPADPVAFLANVDASQKSRTVLLLFVFATALGGALWSWRSVSREAELANLKVDLVSRVSHELKTPLALVRMYGETLGMGRAKDARQVAEFGGIIAREAERLTTLIQRILDFSRQQAGTLSYARAPIDLGELLRKVAETYAPHLESRGVLLIDSLPLDVLVDCDANACESAIVNLLENAAKYGPDGDAEHEVDLVLQRAGDRAVVEVRDRGRGIPNGEHERVFDGFYRASNSGEVRGAGLGLSLVRHFARAHGGDIRALPRDGGGTVMRLELPIAGGQVPPGSHPTEPPLPGPSNPATTP